MRWPAVLDGLRLNASLLRQRVPNLSAAAREVGLRPATVSDLCNGRIPLGRAEVRTLALLAQMANCSLDELVIRGGGVEMIETGIKVLDLFAPLARGGSAGLVARTGMGQMVLLAEIVVHLRRRDVATVVWLPGKHHPALNEVADKAEVVGTSLDEIRSAIEGSRMDRDVLVGVDRGVVTSGELDTLRDQINSTTAPPVTFALVDALGETPDEDAPYGPLETLWQFDTDLAARGYFPAVNPVVSTSTVLEGGHLEPAHLTVQQRARKLLRRYRDLHALVRVQRSDNMQHSRSGGVQNLPEAELQTFRRGERLEAFLSQPFYTAEPFTGKPGQWVTVQETIDGVRRILDGECDGRSVEDLKYLGALPA